MKTVRLRQLAIGALVATAATMPFSIRLCHWSFLLFALLWIIDGGWPTKWHLIKSNSLSWPLPLFFLLHLVGMLYTTNPSAGWLHLEKKAAFLLVPLTLVSTPWLGRREVATLARVFILSCVVAAVYCLGHAGWVAFKGLPDHNFGEATMAEFLRLNPDGSPVWLAFSYISLASGIQGHPTYLGLYLALCLLLLLFFFRHDEVSRIDRIAGKVIFIFFLLFVFFLSSRIATLCAVAITMTGITIKFAGKPQARTFVLQTITALSIALVVYINPVSRYRELQEPAAASVVDLPDYAVTSLQIRLSLLKLSAVAGAGENQWFGSGTGTAENRIREAGIKQGMSNSLGSYDPHNQFIYTFLELGIAGLFCLLSAMVIGLRASWKSKSLTYTGFVTVFAAVCLTESALELQKGIILFSFFGPLLLFHEKHIEESH